MSAPILTWQRKAGLTWLDWEAGGVRAAFPAREGGVSKPPYASLDLGLSVGDEPADVLENRRRLAETIGLPTSRWVVPAQVHGTRLVEVDESYAGRGRDSLDSTVADTDALLTATPGLGLAISYADCVPIVIVADGEGGPLLATAHAGWRGMLAGVVGKAASQLARRGRLIAAVVGPSIGPCCFTVDETLRARFEARFPEAALASTVDLWASARHELVAAGVPASGVTVTGVCTASDERFFSHRREHGLTGRHLTIAWRQYG